MQHHRSPFLNLGLWTACFHRFRHPAVQYDELYTGCHPVWGERLQMIAYWMVPGELLELVTNLRAQSCLKALLRIYLS